VDAGEHEVGGRDALEADGGVELEGAELHVGERTREQVGELADGGGCGEEGAVRLELGVQLGDVRGAAVAGARVLGDLVFCWEVGSAN